MIKTMFLIFLLLFLLPLPSLADSPTVASFTASPSTINSNYTTVLTWTIQGASTGHSLYFSCPPGIKITKAHDIDGVNLQFDCLTGVQVFASGNSVPLACNTPAFTSSLPVSGSSSFTFTNSSLFATSLTIRVLPMIATGLYDATHGLSLSLNISGKTALPDILINSFTVPKTKISSGESLVFSWNAPLASGVNFQIMCSDTITVTNLPCNTLAFSQSLPVVSSTNLSFINNSDSSQSLSIYLLPKNAVKRFQEKYGIARQGDGGYGFVGPKTRVKLNSLDYFTDS